MPPRPIRPKHDSSTPGGFDAAGDSRTAKRKATSSACIPCRKRKSKCDGQEPACTSCVAVYRTECSYHADSEHRQKGALKRDLQSLQQENDALDVIVASLKNLPESESVTLLHHIRGDADVEGIANSLRANAPLPHSFAQQTLEADLPPSTTISPEPANPTSSLPVNRAAQHLGESDRLQPAGEGTSTAAPSVWFSLPQDVEFVEHLLGLYFCWVHPFYQFLSQDLFIRDMERGDTDHCSALLVNAVLACACQYSDRQMARTNPTNSATAGEHFFAEATRILNSTNQPSLTTVQALGILSIRETSMGRESCGYQLAGRCVRTALEIGLHLSVMKDGAGSTDKELRKLVFWATFNLETRAAMAFGRLSQLPRTATDIEQPPIRNSSEADTWRPYVDVNLATSPSAEQPARLLLFHHCLTGLSEIASDVINTFYAPREQFTSRRLTATYARYQQWYQDMPDAFRLENTSLPYVLVLHMYYHSCVLHLFRPYIKLDLRPARLYPRVTCTNCANEISSLMNALRAMYGLRRVCLAVTGFLLSASTIHLINLPSEPAAANLTQALHNLEIISNNHPFAARAVDIVRSLSTKWKIPLPEGAASVGTFRLTGLPSPPASSFFAASIPRLQRSNRSGESSASSQDSPFRPPSSAPAPPPQQTSRQNTTVPGLYSNPATPFETPATTFWTPFPMQSMPMPLADPEMPYVDFSQLDMQDWASVGGLDELSKLPSEPEIADGGMNSFTDWTWQGSG